MLYSNRNATWTTLAPATRKVAEGASNATRAFTGDDMNLHILSLARIICHADQAPELSPLLCLRMPDGGRSLTVMDLEEKDALVSIAAFTGAVRLMGSGRGGRPKEEILRGAALEAYEGKRARKGNLVGGMKVQRVIAEIVAERR